MTDVEKLPCCGNINNGKSGPEEGESGNFTLIQILVNIWSLKLISRLVSVIDFLNFFHD